MRVVAFIPARGGSVRVPGKNLRKVGAISLVERTVLVANEAGCEVVVVSTDDDRTAVVAHRIWYVAPSVPGTSRNYEYHRRKSEHAGSHAQIEEAFAHWLSGQQPYGRPDGVVLLQPTSPFRTAKNIRDAVALLEAGASNVVGVRDIGRESAFRGTVVDDAFYPRRMTGTRPRTQDVEPVHAETGALYAFTRRHWEERGDRMWGLDQRPLVMSWLESFDVDTEEDLKIADALARGLGV